MIKNKDLILQWIDWSKNNYTDFPPYIGDAGDLSNITLDGSFNLEKLAKQVESQAYERGRREMCDEITKDAIQLSDLYTDNLERNCAIEDCYEFILRLIQSKYLTQEDDNT